MIARVRSGADAALLEKIVDGNAPFELKPENGAAAARGKPYHRGILLTHGLSDSPYFMRRLGEFFRHRGFRVMAVLLPGHGTQPGDLLGITRREWAKAVRYGADRLADEVDELYLGGFSMGAALSLCHSLDDGRVRGLFLFAPAFGITRRAAWAKWHALYGWLAPAGGWVSIQPDGDIYKYESFPKNAAAQAYALTRDIARRLKHRTVDVPVFAAASLEDATVDAQATLAFMARASHPANRLVLYAAGGARPLGGVPPERVEWVDSAMPERHILGSAHTAIVLPPEDGHYGAAGDYASCGHYYPDDMERYRACLSPTAAVNLGEVTKANLGRGLLRRLTFNPHFAELEVSVKRFIESL